MRKRRQVRKLDRRRMSPVGGWVLFSLYFSCIILLVLSRLENNQLRDARGLLTDLVAPVLQAASQPAIYARWSKEQLVDYIDLFHELDRLKEENQKLKHWQSQAQRLERRLEHMRALLNAVEEPALKYATGHVIADARGPFARSVLINVGQARGVQNGYAVINGDGFVGRVVHTGESASRAILISDLNSRVPVLVGPASVRAVLSGDNSSRPRLEFVPNSSEVYEGDEVITSGHGGMLPRGLRIGTVVKSGANGYRVQPNAELGELEYVSVLFFNAPVIAAREKQERDAIAAEASALKRKKTSKLAKTEKHATNAARLRSKPR